MQARLKSYSHKSKESLNDDHIHNTGSDSYRKGAEKTLLSKNGVNKHESSRVNLKADRTS
jgi:hypothetical protein